MSRFEEADSRLYLIMVKAIVFDVSRVGLVTVKKAFWSLMDLGEMLR